MHFIRNYRYRICYVYINVYRFIFKYITNLWMRTYPSIKFIFKKKPTLNYTHTQIETSAIYII